MAFLSLAAGCVFLYVQAYMLFRLHAGIYIMQNTVVGGGWLLEEKMKNEDLGVKIKMKKIASKTENNALNHKIASLWVINSKNFAGGVFK